MSAKCTLEGEHLNSEFSLNGNAPKGELDGVEPLVEVWEPISNKEIAAQFRIAWKSGGRVVISADAQSDYYPGNSTELMPILHRYICITPKLQGSRLSLKQKSLMFHQLPSGSY